METQPFVDMKDKCMGCLVGKKISCVFHGLEEAQALGHVVKSFFGDD